MSTTDRADLVVDGTGPLCVTLLLELRERISHTPAGTAVHVLATDQAAPLDLPAWCHMVGHHYLGPIATDHDDRDAYAIRLAADARPSRPGAPWHPAEPPCY